MPYEATEKIQADELQQLGIEQAQNRNLTTAMQLWLQALDIYQQLKDFQGKGNILGNLGLAYHFLGNYQQALKYHQQSLALEEKINSFSNRGEFHNSQEIIDYQLGEYTSARTIGTRSSLGYAHFSLGFTYYWLNDYGQAIKHYQCCLTIALELEQLQSQVIVLAQLGEVYFYLGKYEQSINYHQQAEAIAVEIDDLDSQGNSLNGMGNACVKLGQWEKARNHYQRALPILEQVGNLNGRGNSLAGMGITYSNQNDHHSAISCFKQCLSLFEEIGNHYNQGRALNLLGQAYYFLEDYQQAIDYHQRSLAKSQQLGEIFSEERAKSDLGLVFYKSGWLTEAEKHLRASIEIVESIRQKLGNNDDLKVSIFDRQVEPYQLLQVILVAQNKYEQALEIAERGRTRAFVELLSQHQELLVSQQAATELLDIDRIRQIAREHEATLIEYSLIKTKGIKPEKLYIWAIASTGEIDFCWVNLEPLAQQRIALSDLVIQVREGLEIKDDIWRDFSIPTATTVPLKPKTINLEPLRQLYRYLIQPLANFLKETANTNLIIIPQGDLFLVPFSALQEPQTKKFLGDEYTIVTIPSIQLLALTRQQQQRQAGDRRRRSWNARPLNALVVGNPKMPSLGNPPSPLQSLPAAEAEAVVISSLLNSQSLVGKQATKANILQQLPNAKLVHLATHALLNTLDGSEIPGAIALASSLGDGGFLTAANILERYASPQGKPLNAAMIVLSACATGLGKITGDGVIGLSRSLMASGIPSLVVSLWSVNDWSTAFLMSKFYQNLLIHHNIAQALQEAQYWLRNATKQGLDRYLEQLPLDSQHKKNFQSDITSERKPFESPYYWAAFCALGQPQCHL